MRKYSLWRGVPHCPVSNPHIEFTRIVGLRRDEEGQWTDAFDVVVADHVDLLKAESKGQLKRVKGPVRAADGAAARALLQPEPPKPVAKPKPKGGDA